MQVFDTGVLADLAQTSLQKAQQIFINAFGADVNLSSETSNGQLIQEIADLLIEKETQLLYLYNYLYNPTKASGNFLDGIAAFNQITRKQAIPAIAVCSVTGLSGTVIPAGAKVLNTNNDVFIVGAATTIGMSGTATINVTAASPGSSVLVTVNTINRIVQQITGWDSVNNPADGVIGTDKETDSEFRRRRLDSLALNSVAIFTSLVSALANTADVVDYFLLPNYTNLPITEDGVTVDPHSIYLSIYGGTDQAIAKLLYEKLSGGCGMNGGTTVNYNVPDPNSPGDTLFVFIAKFERPTPTPIKVEVSIKQDLAYPSDIEEQIQQAVVDNFYGKDGTPKVRIGKTFYNSRFYPPIVKLGVFEILTLTIGTVGGTQGVSVDLPITEIPTLTSADVVVTLVP